MLDLVGLRRLLLLFNEAVPGLDGLFCRIEVVEALMSLLGV